MMLDATYLAFSFMLISLNVCEKERILYVWRECSWRKQAKPTFFFFSGSVMSMATNAGGLSSSGGSVVGKGGGEAAIVSRSRRGLSGAMLDSYPPQSPGITKKNI